MLIYSILLEIFLIYYFLYFNIKKLIFRRFIILFHNSLLFYLYILLDFKKELNILI